MIKRYLSIAIVIISSVLLLTSCEDDDETVSGCTNTEACNYNSSANSNDGSCNFICLTDNEKTRVVDFVQSAINHVQSVGETAAFAEFNDTAGSFIDNELYIFVWDSVANVLAHGFQSSLIGTNVMNLQDVKGKYFVQEIYDILKTNDEAWGWYYWNNPLTTTIDKKFTYAKKYNDMIVASGTYNVQ